MLVRKETNPDDLEGMIAAAGILTSRGGKTSHAAVVARGMGKTCVCGAEELDVDVAAKVAKANGTTILEGDVISIDGSTGEVFLGAVPVMPSPVVLYLEHGLDHALADADEETRLLVQSVDRLLEHADDTRRLRVRANADTAEDAARARHLGAEGIGLTRTEHMFLGDRRVLIERVILADNATDREEALAALLPLQTQGLHRAARGDGRAARHHPAARPAAARVPAQPHRALRARRGRGGRGTSRRQGPRAARGRGAAARVQPDARPARRPARPGHPRPVRAAGPGDRGGGGQPAQGRRRPEGGDHGPAGRVGDGAAPRRRRDRRHRARDRRRARASSCTSPSAP